MRRLGQPRAQNEGERSNPTTNGTNKREGAKRTECKLLRLCLEVVRHPVTRGQQPLWEGRQRAQTKVTMHWNPISKDRVRNFFIINYYAKCLVNGTIVR